VRARHNVENRLNSIKNLAKNVVAPLFINESNLNVVGFPVKHFTCMKVSPQDVAGLWDEGIRLKWDRPAVRTSSTSDMSSSLSRSLPQHRMPQNVAADATDEEGSSILAFSTGSKRTGSSQEQVNCPVPKKARFGD
jgi:hypothetical protein